MPRVAHFSSDFLPASQAFVYREVTGHVRWEVEAFAQRRQNPDRFPFEPVHTLGPGRGLPGLLERAAYLAALRSPTFAARFRRNPFDLIHAQFGPAGVQALAFAERFDLPLVCTFGGVDVAALEPRMRGRPDYLLYRLRAPRLLRHADRLLAVSRDLADRLVRLGAPPDRVHVFHRGVEVPAVQPPRPRPGPGGPVVLMVGRLVEKKGFRDGLAAAALLHREGLPLQVRIVGGGPLEQDLLARARDGGLLGPRTFAGSLTQEEVFREMERAHVLLAPSVTAGDGDTEGIPNVLKEACGRGLPAVVTRHGGLPEAVEEGVTGFVVPERAPEALASRLRVLLADAERAAQVGGAAREKMAREFSLPRSIAILEDHYDAVRAGRGRAPP